MRRKMMKSKLKKIKTDKMHAKRSRKALKRKLAPRMAHLKKLRAHVRRAKRAAAEANAS